MKKGLWVVTAGLVLVGCTSMKIDSAISEYEAKAERVELGDSKDEVLSVLQPTQEAIPSENRKRPEKYIKDGVRVEIYYMRSARYADGLTTDDEFVPYLFNDEKLVGIGWQVLGGPKTQSQTSSDTFITNQNTTIVY